MPRQSASSHWGGITGNLAAGYPPDRQHMSDSSSEEDVMLLTNSRSTTSPVKRRTMHLHGMIGKRNILILIDSGANYSFVDAKLTKELQLPT